MAIKVNELIPENIWDGKSVKGMLTWLDNIMMAKPAKPMLKATGIPIKTKTIRRTNNRKVTNKNPPNNNEIFKKYNYK
jgi:hypothetical protein